MAAADALACTIGIDAGEERRVHGLALLLAALDDRRRRIRRRRELDGALLRVLAAERLRHVAERHPAGRVTLLRLQLERLGGLLAIQADRHEGDEEMVGALSR